MPPELWQFVTDVVRFGDVVTQPSSITPDTQTNSPEDILRSSTKLFSGLLQVADKGDKAVSGTAEYSMRESGENVFEDCRENLKFFVKSPSFLTALLRQTFPPGSVEIDLLGPVIKVASQVARCHPWDLILFVINVHACFLSKDFREMVRNIALHSSDLAESSSSFEQRKEEA